MPEASTGLGREGRSADTEGPGAWETRFAPKQEFRGMLVPPVRAANVPGSWGGRRWLERTSLLGVHGRAFQPCAGLKGRGLW